MCIIQPRSLIGFVCKWYADHVAVNLVAGAVCIAIDIAQGCELTAHVCAPIGKQYHRRNRCHQHLRPHHRHHHRQHRSNQIQPDLTMPSNSNYAHPDPARCSHTKSYQAISNYIHPDPFRSSQIHPDPARSEPARSIQIQRKTTRSSQGNQIQPDQTRSNQIQPDPASATPTQIQQGPTRSSQIQPDQNQPDARNLSAIFWDLGDTL